MWCEIVKCGKITEIELTVIGGRCHMRKGNNKLAQLRTFQKNADMSLQSIIEIAFQVLVNPIILYDLDCKILAYPQAIAGSPFEKSFNDNGVISHEMRVSSANEGFADLMIRPKKVVFLESPELNFKCFFGKLFNKDGFPVSCISVIEAMKPFEDDDIVLVEAICDMLAKEICKIPYYQAYPQKILDIYINRLIDGDTEDSEFFLGKVEAIYNGLKSNIYLAVADIGQCDPAYIKLDYYRDLFKRTRPAFKYSIYSNYIVIILSEEEKVFYPKRVFNRLNRIFEQENIKVGVSSRFENLFKLKQYYIEAVNALNNGLTSKRNQWIFWHGEDNNN